MKNHEQPDYDYLVQLFENELMAEELAENIHDSNVCHESEDIDDNVECTDDTENLVTLDFNGDNNETSLTVIHEFKWTIPEKYILGVVIDVGEGGRFLVGEHLGNGYTGFVRSGKKLIF